MDDILPLFKSQYSLGRSILTLEKAGSSEESGPDSIVDIAVENNLSKIFMVEDSMSGFLQAYDSLSEKKIDLVFGLRVTVCPTVEEKSEDAVSKSSKYVILCKNTEGYQRLIKIASDSHKLGFYYVPRVDFQILEKYKVPATIYVTTRFLNKSVDMWWYELGNIIQKKTELSFDHDNKKFYYGNGNAAYKILKIISKYKKN